MLYIFLTLVSGIFSGMLSIYFRVLELKKEIILMPKHLMTQIALFIIFALIFGEFYSNVVIDLGFIELGWFIIYVLLSSASYYGVQVFYEYFSGNTLFASEEEMKKYLDKLDGEM